MIRVNDDYWSWKKWAFAHGALINEMTHFADLACCFIESVPVRVTVSRPSTHAPSVVGADSDPRLLLHRGSESAPATDGACVERSKAEAPQTPLPHSIESQVVAIEFADGSLAAIFATAFGSFGYPKELVEVYHNGAAIIIDHLVEMRVAGVIDEPFRTVFPIPNDRYPEIEAQGIEGFYQRIACRSARGTGEGRQLDPAADPRQGALRPARRLRPVHRDRRRTGLQRPSRRRPDRHHPPRPRVRRARRHPGGDQIGGLPMTLHAVTGAFGYSGKYIAHRLLERGRRSSR